MTREKREASCIQNQKHLSNSRRFSP